MNVLPTIVSPVCVLIPVYNANEKLIETLKSLDKGFPLNILIVDDGSDKPIKIDKEQFLPHFIQIHRKNINSGIENTLNLGVEIIYDQGFKYFARIDCGDIALNNRFEKQYNIMSSHTNLAWIGGGAQAIDSVKKILYTLKPPLTDTNIKKLFFFKGTYVHPALMFNTHYVIKVGNYTKNFEAAEDMDLLLRLLKYYKAQNLAENVVQFEIKPNGISGSKRKTQVLSTLNLQIRYFDLGNIYWYLGLIKNLGHMLFPQSIVVRLKKIFFK